jgi:hypothetical protein
VPDVRRKGRPVRILKTLLLLALSGFGAILLYGYGRNHPEDLPWTKLDLARPVGTFTGRKLAQLSGNGKQCQALLGRAGVKYTALPPRSGAGQCGYRGAVRFTRGGAIDIGYRPADLGTSCPVAAGLALWEWNVVQPAALARLGRKVAAIEHYGSYSCRRMYGRSQGNWSEHSTANAIDIAAFRLDDGSRISVVGDWKGTDEEARFLHDVRDGACRLFATVLSPDYNAAHRDHLHLDQAGRGAFGWRACR